jgi:hypothetical protein
MRRFVLPVLAAPAVAGAARPLLGVTGNTDRFLGQTAQDSTVGEDQARHLPGETDRVRVAALLGNGRALPHSGLGHGLLAAGG